MDDKEKIHLLSLELIPVINDLDSGTKKVVLDHIDGCNECKRLYTKAIDFDESFPEAETQQDFEIKPLKKLVQFNTGLKLLLVIVRAIILFYIIYPNIKYFISESPMMAFNLIQSGIFMFYIPAVVFLLVFTVTFFNKKWSVVSLTFDLLIVLFLDDLIKLLF